MSWEGARYNKVFRYRRFKVGIRVYTHKYPTTSDRWVFQPYLVYDRKSK